MIDLYILCSGLEGSALAHASIMKWFFHMRTWYPMECASAKEEMEGRLGADIMELVIKEQ